MAFEAGCRRERPAASMPHLIWTQRAVFDLDRLRNFLFANSPSAAQRAMTTILQSARELSRHPLLGRPATDIQPSCREMIIRFGKGAYLLLYEVQEDRLVIHSIRHSREESY